MNIFPADKVEPGSIISTTSSGFVLFIIHRLTLKFPHLNCRIVSYKVDQNIIYSVNHQGSPSEYFGKISVRIEGPLNFFLKPDQVSLEFSEMIYLRFTTHIILG